MKKHKPHKKHTDRMNNGKSPEQILRNLGLTKEQVENAGKQMKFVMPGNTPEAKRLVDNLRMV
jgi:hypothetical protein